MRKPCPRCGSQEVVKIVYGMPSNETSEKVKRREVEIGGCLPSPAAPQWACKSCGFEFGRTLRPVR
jgi:predicted RNA-binding Zn-ribbon protein involved in translation (DUF1610 family)